MTSGPLEGLRVVEFGRFVTAPYTAKLLGDLGADVVKLEGLDGDPFRKFSGTVELSPHFIALNRNKRSVAIDVASEDGRRAMRELILDSDVFIENSRPGSMARMRLDYEDLREEHPALIYCSITGTGPTGPYVDRPAYDMVGQALSGLAHTTLDPDTMRPTGTNTSDSVTGMTAALAILAAVAHRHRTGEGQRVDIDMLSSSVAFLGAEAQIFFDTGVAPGPLTRPANSLSFALRCSDGAPIGMHLSSIPKFWEGLTRVIGREDLRDDPRFRTRADRSANYLELDTELQAEFVKRPRAEWLAELVAADVPVGPIYSLGEVFDDPQVIHQGIERTMTHSTLGSMRTVGPPHAFSAFPELPLAAPPRLGEHTEDLLAGARDTRPSHFEAASERA
jgi:formyl-CoA transferase